MAMDLKKSLRLSIADKGVKHKDLAKALGTSNQQVSNWLKSGAIKQSSIIDIADYFEIPVSEFIALGEDK